MWAGTEVIPALVSNAIIRLVFLWEEHVQNNKYQVQHKKSM